MAETEVTREMILGKITDVLEAAGVDRDKVVEQSTFNVARKDEDPEHNLGLDSLDLTELIMELEDGFGLKIPDADAETLITVGAAVDYVYGRRDEITLPDTTETAPA
ncbi:MAG TPA: acyl carrier protein [Candidatus Saccharimonadales bacterium]|nr:acyl carrier protein [Candidatus Saccharimonadales bacterium]